MTDTPERALLREVLAEFDAALPYTDSRVDYVEPQIPRVTIEEIRALLAEPEGEEPTLRSMAGAAPDLTGGVESVEWLRRKRAAMEDNYAAYATPRSRAEAEAMVAKPLTMSAGRMAWYRYTEKNDRTLNLYLPDLLREIDALRAALLAALTGGTE